MKTIKSLSIIAICAILFSCNKEANDMFSNYGENLNSNSYGVNPNILCEPEEPFVMFCTQQEVPLCANNTPIGTVTVKTGSDGNIYVVYKTTGTWYFKELFLFTGDAPSVPCTASGTAIPDLFPFTKSFSTLTKEYTFIVPDMPSAFTVAANAEVVKLSANLNNILEEHSAWANGCAGNTRVNVSVN